MSHQSSNEPLVQFLRKHRSSPPAPKREIEHSLMAQIEAENRLGEMATVPKVRHQRWAFGGVIAASVLLLFTSIRFLQPTPSSPQEMAELEAFIMENWEAVITPTPTETSWFISESPESLNRR